MIKYKRTLDSLDDISVSVSIEVDPFWTTREDYFVPAFAVTTIVMIQDEGGVVVNNREDDSVAWSSDMDFNFGVFRIMPKVNTRYGNDSQEREDIYAFLYTVRDSVLYDVDQRFRTLPDALDKAFS